MSETFISYLKTNDEFTTLPTLCTDGETAQQPTVMNKLRGSFKRLKSSPRLISCKTLNDNLIKSKSLLSFLMTVNDPSANCIQGYNTYDQQVDEYLLLNPISIERFIEHYQSKAKDSDLGFFSEFSILEKASQRNLYKKFKLADKPSKKDRFQNVLPYKHSIVKLSPLSNKNYLFKTESEMANISDMKIENETYINANFIPGYYSSYEYIATLAPWNTDVVDDFFRMVLQYKIRIIVNLVEYEKISYFPKWTSDEPIRRRINGEELSVKLVHENKFENFEIKQVQFLKSEENTIIHEAYQFHFTTWRDFGCPEQEESLLTFIETVRFYYNRSKHEHHLEETSKENPPIIVHCRAGIGRTGTYIAIDYLWQRLNVEFLQPEIDRKHIWQQLLHMYERKYFQKQNQKSLISAEKEEKLHRNTSKTDYSKLSIQNKFYTSDKCSCSSKTNFEQGNFEEGFEEFDLLAKLPKKYTIDIYSLIYKMRSYRMGMVQTESQYAYIHKCIKYILEHWRCFNTEIGTEITKSVLDRHDDGVNLSYGLPTEVQITSDDDLSEDDGVFRPLSTILEEPDQFSQI